MLKISGSFPKPNSIVSVFGAAVVWIAFSASAKSQELAFNPPYPRLYLHASGIKTVDPAEIEVIARYNVAMFGLWRTWSSSGYTVKTLPTYIKTRNPNIKLIMANSFVQTDNRRPGSTSDIYDKMFAEKGANGRGDWWLRTASGGHISGYRDFLWRRNISPVVTLDSQGRNPGQWHFHWLYAKSTDGVDRATNGYGMREGEWDGIYEDDQYLFKFYSPIGDYNSDGITDDPLNATTKQWIMDGHWSYRNAVKAAEPNWLFFGNVASHLGEVDNGVYPMPESFVGINDGSIMEQINFAEKLHGWTGVMRRYRLGLSWLSEPKAGVFMVDIQKYREIYPSANYTDYRWNRYALCSALLDNGLYAVGDSANGSWTVVRWFDEFWGGSLRKTGYLGYPIDPPQFSAWSKGIYRRQFENGLVLVNPKGNGLQTVEVGTGWRRISGTEDPIHNNGQPVNSITLNEQDGIILVRDGLANAPRAPSDLVIIQ